MGDLKYIGQILHHNLCIRDGEKESVTNPAFLVLILAFCDHQIFWEM